MAAYEQRAFRAGGGTHIGVTGVSLRVIRKGTSNRPPPSLPISPAYQMRGPPENRQPAHHGTVQKQKVRDADGTGR